MSEPLTDDYLAQVKDVASRAFNGEGWFVDISLLVREIRQQREDRKKLIDALTSGNFCRTVEHNQGMCDCDKVRTLFERMS